MITRDIAEIIVQETSKIMNLNVNIMNDKGIIIASGDQSRLNVIHEGALGVMKSREPVYITNETIDFFRGAQPGINLPIHFQEKIVGVIGITGDPNEIGDRGGLVKMMTELMIKQAYMTSQSEWRQKTREMIIEELLKESPSPDHVNRWLSLLNIKLEGPFVITVMEMAETSFSNHLLLKCTEDILGSENVLSGFVHINKLLIILSNTSVDSVEKRLLSLYQKLEKQKFQIRLSYSPPISELYSIAQGYRECEIALVITNPSIKFVSYIDVEPKALVRQINPKHAEQFSERVLQGSLKKHIETLQAFFDCNLNIKDTSEKLFIHRNTLIYRLNKIKTESGYDPQHFRDAFALQMGIWLIRIRD